MGAALAWASDDDLDVAAEQREAAEQAAFGDAAKLAAQQGGNLRLGQSEDFRGFLPGEATLLDDFGDFRDELSLHEHVVAVGIAEIGVDVSAAFLDGNFTARGTFGFHGNSEYVHIGIRASKGGRLKSAAASETHREKTAGLKAAATKTLNPDLSLLSFRPVLCLVLFCCEEGDPKAPECASVGGAVRKAVQELKVES